MVLHTWGQNLSHHPHLHSVVPAGGLDTNGRWVACRSEKILLPVRVLSRLFRGLFLHHLRKAHLQGRLRFAGTLRDLEHFEAFCLTLREAKRTEWVVYSKRPFGGPEQVVAYLGRYTHRVAISNQRLVEARNGQVSFQWKDYRSGQRDLVMQLDGVEFLRHFLLHTLPIGFVRIRHYGFLAHRARKASLAQARACLCRSTVASTTPPAENPQSASPKSLCLLSAERGTHRHHSGPTGAQKSRVDV